MTEEMDVVRENMDYCQQQLQELKAELCETACVSGYISTIAMGEKWDAIWSKHLA